MKKSILIFSIVFLCLSVKSQTIRLPLTQDSTIEYASIIKLKDSTIKKAQLYSLVRAWFGDRFVNSKYVLQVEDTNAGRLLAKGSSSKGYNFTIEVLIKDGKYKYRVYSLEWNEYQPRPFLTSNVSEAYLRYLHNKPENLGFEGKKKAMKVYDKIFLDLDQDINDNIINSLQVGILKQKKLDDF